MKIISSMEGGNFSSVLNVLPNEIKKELLERNLLPQTEEIRLRINREIELYTFTDNFFLPLIATREDINFILNKSMNYSIYAHENEIRNAFITLVGGHRIGFTGRVIHKNGEIVKIDNFSSLNIRLAREVIGCSEHILPNLFSGKTLLSSLIVSPPQVGKTTLLRDITRCISNGNNNISGYKVGLVDERGEISACINGESQLDVGKRTDIMDSCPKSKAMSLLIRSMSPQVIIADEIGGSEDFSALTNASASGVSVISTAHASTMEELVSRPNMVKIIATKLFDRYIFIQRQDNIISAKEIYNKDFARI